MPAFSNLLDVVKLEAGRLVIEKKAHRVALLVKDAIEMQQSLAVAKGLSLGAEVRTGADLEVPCDRERLFEVFANLIGNAIKFTPRGGSITLRAPNQITFFARLSLFSAAVIGRSVIINAQAERHHGRAARARNEDA